LTYVFHGARNPGPQEYGRGGLAPARRCLPGRKGLRDGDPEAGSQKSSSHLKTDCRPLWADFHSNYFKMSMKTIGKSDLLRIRRKSNPCNKCSFG
jgi:hypothetical protein